MTQSPVTSRRVEVLSLRVAAVVAVVAATAALRDAMVDEGALATAATVFCGVFVQALPFLGLGVVISGLVATFVSAERLAGVLPRRPAAAVVTAGLGGALLPGCECGSVPVARRLFGAGNVGAAALTFMLAAPAINPVVLVSTAVAFPEEPLLVVARCLASLLTAVVMGLLWTRFGRDEWITRRLPRTHHVHGESRWTTFTEAARHDFLQAASFLVIGAAAAAALNVMVPESVFESFAGQLVVGVLFMAVLAVVLSLCSEADAFVAASLSMVPLLPRLVFLVVGPAIDLKLFAMQAGMFGRAFAFRFAPATFAVAVLMATGIGLLILGPR